MARTLTASSSAPAALSWVVAALAASTIAAIVYLLLAGSLGS